MPQPPNLNKMLEQAQEMIAQQQEAQEKLKSERVEASAGGGMVKVVMTGDMRLRVDRRSTPTPSIPRTSRCSRTWSSRRVNEALRSAEELQQKRWAGPATPAASTR